MRRTNKRTKLSQWQLRICAALRELQNESACSNRQLHRLSQTLSPFLQHQIPRNWDAADRLFHEEAGVADEQLVICERCANPNVWTKPNVPENCPRCQRPLKNPDGHQNITHYFPLGPRLQSLMRTASYKLLLQYEHTRKKNASCFTDVYDSPGTCDVRYVSVFLYNFIQNAL